MKLIQLTQIHKMKGSENSVFLPILINPDEIELIAQGSEATSMVIDLNASAVRKASLIQMKNGAKFACTETFEQIKTIITDTPSIL